MGRDAVHGNLQLDEQWLGNWRSADQRDRYDQSRALTRQITAKSTGSLRKRCPCRYFANA